MRVHVGRHLVVQAALELAALPRQLLRVQRQVLHTGSRSGNGLELRDIIGAAKFAATDTQTADEPRLLTGADLLHLHADVELFCEVLDELAEVHTAVGNVIEDGLGAVSLEFHIANLHLQAQVSSQHAGPDHGFLLAGDSLLPALDVEGTRLAVNLLELRLGGVYALTLHLSAHDGPFQRHNAQVVPRGSLYHHQVSGFDALARCIHVNPLAGILEPDLVKVVKLLLGNTLQRIVYLQLAASLPVFDVCLARGLVRHHHTATKAVKLNGFIRKIVHKLYS